MKAQGIKLNLTTKLSINNNIETKLKPIVITKNGVYTPNKNEGFSEIIVDVK